MVRCRRLVAVGLWAAYFWVLRFDVRLVPVAAGTFVVLDAVAAGLEGAYPGALAGAIGAVVLVAILAFLWHRSLAGEGGAEPGGVTNAAAG